MKSPEVFAVYYEDPDPQKAKEVVNSLIDIFIEENIREKKREAQAGVEYAERQAEIYKEKLAEAEGKLENFREKHSLQLPGKEVDMNVQMLVHFQSDAARIKMDINETKQKISKTQRQLSGEEPVIISQELMELNPVVARLNNELEELKVKLDTLLIEDPDSEEIIQVQQQIEEKRDQLEDEIKKTVTAETAVEDPLFYQRLKEKLNEAEEVLEDLQDREEELQQQVKVYEKRLSSLPEQEREYSRLRRDVEINNEIYKMLKMKAAESRLTAVELEQRGVNYELLEEGRLPLRPSRPQKLLIAIVALVLGMISGVGCVFIAEIADHSFKDTEDARSYLSLPFLGSVPKIMTKNEIRRRQRNQRNIVILFIVLIVSLIAAGIISTYQQQQKVSEILTTQEQQSQTR
jgi:polysaccharide chain length determinant protein (PEP-CTERM system associated)